MTDLAKQIAGCVSALQRFLPEVFSSLGAFVVEFVRQIGDEVFEVSKLQWTPYVFISVGVEGVKVHPEGAWEQQGVLGERRAAVIQHWAVQIANRIITIWNRLFRSAYRLKLLQTVYMMKARTKFLLFLLSYLRNDSNAGSEVMESDVFDVDAINKDLSLCRL